MAELDDLLKEMERRQRQDDRALKPAVPDFSGLFASAGVTQIEGTDDESPVVPLPVDAATITDGAWMIQGFATILYSGGDGDVRARLVTSALAPISDWFYSVESGASPGVFVPAHVAVFGNSDAARLQFEAVPGTGTPDEGQGTITGVLLGTQPT